MTWNRLIYPNWNGCRSWQRFRCHPNSNLDSATTKHALCLQRTRRSLFTASFLSRGQTFFYLRHHLVRLIACFRHSSQHSRCSIGAILHKIDLFMTVTWLSDCSDPASLSIKGVMLHPRDKPSPAIYALSYLWLDRAERGGYRLIDSCK